VFTFSVFDRQKQATDAVETSQSDSVAARPITAPASHNIRPLRVADDDAAHDVAVATR